MKDIDVMWQCLLIGGTGSLAGVAALLRGGKRKLDSRDFWSAILNSGLYSIAMAALVFWKLGTEDNFWIAVFVSIMAGLGGNTAIEFMLGLIRLGAEQYMRGRKGKFKSDN